MSEGDGSGTEESEEEALAQATQEGERQYHIEVAPGEVADTVLLPGDPGRVDEVVSSWEHHEEVAEHREYRTATGSYEGTDISVTSTGIGSPSAAIAVEELAEVGADTFIRVGSCGGLQPELEVGDLVITAGAVRGEATSDAYVRKSYPASASPEVVSALVAAAEELGYDYHVGLTASTDSFYPGQGREGFGGYQSPEGEQLMRELRAANVLNVEMEASAVCTLANVYGLRAGAVCTVFANRSTGEFRTEGEGEAARTASLATSILAGMDRLKREAGADHWHPGLALER
jgi:uridine phosphorylase